nr:hypothetical protein Iba_chr01aCG16590 [Ipomoea batatas]GMD69378.1 hypothetical protein Iba_chr12dCG18410 [Ipomoea batatas]GME11424.1 hypothetical protein Iba_scaffold11619CG0110 [Ipomoea batatas]GME18203.1 hypothetical protein Iba_scaffold20116CG0010 [Ipomoea batatas]
MAKARQNLLRKIVPTKDEGGEVRELRQKLWQVSDKQSAKGRNPTTVRRKAVGEAEGREVNGDDNLSPSITHNGCPITQRVGSRIHPVIESNSGIGELIGLDSEQLK